MTHHLPTARRFRLAVACALLVVVGGCSSDGDTRAVAPVAEDSTDRSSGGISAGRTGLDSEADFAIEFGECLVTEDGMALFATNAGTKTSSFNVEVDFFDANGEVLGTQTAGSLALRPNEQARLSNGLRPLPSGADSDTPATGCQPRAARQGDPSVLQSGSSGLDETTFTCRHADTDIVGDIVGELIAPASAHDTTVRVTIAWVVDDLRIATSVYNVPISPTGVTAPLSSIIKAPAEPVACEVVEARQYD